MAKKFLTGLRLVNLSSDPASGQEGELYFNTSASIAKIYKNGSWTDLDTVGGGSLTQEQIQDYIAPLFTSASNTNVVAIYDDANNVINLNTSGSLISVDSISSPDFIQFDTTANVTPVTGLLGWDSVEGTLNLGISSTKHIHVGEESVYRVRNSTGSTISKGTALYASGVEPSGRIDVDKYVADGSVREVRFMGLATENISDGVNGFVQHFGYVRDLDTRGTASTAISVGDEDWSAGDILYVHPTVPGKLTNIKPQHAIIVALLIIRHQTTGILFVRPSSGGHMEDIHDVLITSASVNQALVYDSDGLWKNEYIVNSINGTGDQIDINNETGTGDIVLSLPNELITPGNLTVTGNLTVSGSTTYINTQTLNIEDNIVTLNSNVTGSPTGTAGIEVERGTETNSYILWDESLQAWNFSNDIETFAVRSSNSLQLDVSASVGYSGEIDLTTAFAELNINTDGSIDLRPGDISGFEMYKFTKSYLQFPDLSQQDTAFLGMPSYDTGDLAEGTNLYFTNERAVTALDSTLSNYLTLSSASSTYLTQANAASTYLTQTNASATYLTQANASAIYQPIGSYLTSETDPVFSASDAAGIDSTDISNWNTAYGWGNHALAGYLTSETDPVFSASDAASITSASISNWNTAYGWGNHALAGYLTSYSETDTLETVTDRGAASSNAITITNTTPSTSNSTGALVISGGLGVGDSVWIHGDLHVAGTTITENTQTVASHDNMIYLNAAFDSTITNAVYASGSITYTADNLYEVGMDIRITGVDPAGFNISSGDGLTVASATPTQFIVVKSDPGSSYVSGGTAHAKTEANADLGFAGGYYSGGYAHAGLFRDASDGIFKFFDGYTPEPDEAVNIDTGHVSFSFAPLKAESLDVVDASTTRTNLGLVIGTNVQAYNATLAAVAGGTYTGDDSIITLGTIATGTWNGSTIGYQYGGTGLTTLGTAGQVLTVNAGATAIEWATPSGGGGGLSTTTTSITTNSATAIESFAIATSRTAEAIVQITQGTDYYSSKVLLIHDGTTVKITEYAILESTVGAIPVTISASISGSNLELLATITDAATTNATAKVILIEVAV